MKKKQYKKLKRLISAQDMMFKLFIERVETRLLEVIESKGVDYQNVSNRLCFIQDELKNKNKEQLLVQAKIDASKEIIALLEQDIKEKYPEKLNRLQVTAIEDKAYLDSLIKFIKRQQKVIN